MTRRRQATGTGLGKVAATTFRLTAANREGIEAYATARGISVNMAVNEAVRLLLHRDAQSFVENLGMES